MDNENIIVRLAKSSEEIKAAQRLRYKVFYEEGGAIPSRKTARARLDIDIYDEAADHLIAIYKNPLTKKQDVIGTYRLLRQCAAKKIGGFYTSREFDISLLLNNEKNLLELGRSCVAKNYRTRATLQKLWTGIAAYVFEHGITMMIGCASLPGTDIKKHRAVLDFLHKNNIAPEDIRPRVLDSVNAVRLWDHTQNIKSAVALSSRDDLKALPPLIKGYLKLGAYIGNGAMIDPELNTIDVCIVLPVKNVSARYVSFYGRQAHRHQTQSSAKETEYV